MPVVAVANELGSSASSPHASSVTAVCDRSMTVVEKLVAFHWRNLVLC